MTSDNSSGGIGILGVLGCIFVALKLAGVGAIANWSWWWVTAPFWGGAALGVAITAAGVVITGIVALCKALFN